MKSTAVATVTDKYVRRERDKWSSAITKKKNGYNGEQTSRALNVAIDRLPLATKRINYSSGIGSLINSASSPSATKKQKEKKRNFTL